MKYLTSKNDTKLDGIAWGFIIFWALLTGAFFLFTSSDCASSWEHPKGEINFICNVVSDLKDSKVDLACQIKAKKQEENDAGILDGSEEKRVDKKEDKKVD